LVSESARIALDLAAVDAMTDDELEAVLDDFNEGLPDQTITACTA
jgi:hypothetical protein